jgi:predicted SAM-dependent methyltransferase
VKTKNSVIFATIIFHKKLHQSTILLITAPNLKNTGKHYIYDINKNNDKSVKYIKKTIIGDVNYIDDIKDYIDDIMKIYLTNHGNLVNSGDKGYIDKFIDVYLHQYIDRNRNMRIELIDKLIPIMND